MFWCKICFSVLEEGRVVGQSLVVAGIRPGGNLHGLFLLLSTFFVFDRGGHGCSLIVRIDCAGGQTRDSVGAETVGCSKIVDSNEDRKQKRRGVQRVGRKGEQLRNQDNHTCRAHGIPTVMGPAPDRLFGHGC